jgi:hypothetical protein
LVDVGLKRAHLEALQEKTRLRKIKEEAHNLDIGIWIPESSDNHPAVDDVEAPESRQVLALAPLQASPLFLVLFRSLFWNLVL